MPREFPEYNWITPRTLDQALLQKNYDDAFKRQSSRQHEKMRIRRMLISNYIKDTGDHNTAHIAVVLDIKISTLLRDIRAMGYKTKAGIIL